MKMTNEEAKRFLKENPSPEGGLGWLAEQVGMSTRHTGELRRQLGLPKLQKGEKPPVGISDQQRFEMEMEKLRVKREGGSLRKQYDIALAEILKLREEMETIIEVQNSVSTYSIIPSKKTGGEATAFVIASDWHVEENVKPETVNGTNEYNMAEAKKRAEKFFTHALQLVKKEQQDVQINTLVLALLGDFFSGNIHEELLETCEVGPQDAMMYAQNLIASGIEYLLKNSKLDIVVPCAVGNHSRMTQKVHVSTEHSNSLEWAMYNFLAKYFEKEKRVKFVLTRSYHNYLDVYGYVIRFHHGHAIKGGGGVGGVTIPVLRQIGRWDMDTKAYLDVFGHFHQRMHHNKFVINGSLIGDSPYGKRLGFTGRPEQAFFLIDKKRGITVTCPILVN